MYKGKAFELKAIDDGLVELIFNLDDESVNKFNTMAMNELSEAIAVLESADNIQGLILSSGKDVFVVGADINEFGAVFSEGEDAIKSYLKTSNDIFSRLEDLPFPTVAAINGYALGGGTELCLACDLRVASNKAKMGLPETKLGIIPGWGGTVRLPRLAGADVAIDWISSGKEQPAEKAFNDGVVDAVVAHEKLVDCALILLQRAVSGEIDYKTRRDEKRSPLKLNDTESLLSFESSKAFVKGIAGRNYPAPVTAIQAMQTAAKFDRDDALNVEASEFAKLAISPVAQALTGLFLGDQALGKKAKLWAAKADKKIERAGVVGAGIMGGGIAYQSAYKKVPVVMKDVAQAGIDLGLAEASKLLSKRVEKGRLSQIDMASALNRITATLSYAEFGSLDIVVEAVVENVSVKQKVLSELETKCAEDAVLCSNTSTISITELAKSLSRPEKFCGMHFFNPVHAMPLVEVIRGEKTSDETVARTVAYANTLGKKAVVVKDCPGFLVNRVLFPYFAGFAMLLRDGADYQFIDKTMERWGWPMGPAYLMDVVGLDTAVHAEGVMASGFPDRMKRDFKAASDELFEKGLLGQKSGQGFYVYEKDKKGKPQKRVSEDALKLVSQVAGGESKEFSEEEVIARMMIPMATELLRCLDEGIVESAHEADMALIYGLGFPPFRGGLLRWVDSIGLNVFGEMAERYADLGSLYQLTDSMRGRISSNQQFYPVNKG